MYTTQIIAALICAFVLSAVFTWIEIPVLKKKQMGQNIREEGPQSHKSKAGTPSMGGIALIGGACVSAAAVSLAAGVFDIRLAVMIIVTVAFGLVGFIDDFRKVIKKQNEGLTAKEKMAFQLVISAAVAVYAYFRNETMVYIPFADTYADFGILYIPFIMFAVVAMTNAVNLTDGLDGLAAGCTALSSLFLALLAGMFTYGNVVCFAAAISGGCLGFLVFNRNPAKVFMGDTGSLALGGALVIAAVSMRMELFLLIAGLTYVIEALSVIIQVVSFQTTGKRVFRMSPIHHHFELGGMNEKRVVIMFWGFTAVCCMLGLLTLGF